MGSLFSVIVPVYKVEKYLEQCIQSILNQTFTNLEIILVDDGSPDNCPKICDKYAQQDSRVKVVHKNNGGIVSARQAGLELATGDYIACVDSDDWLSPNYFEIFHNEISKNNSDIVCCGAVWFYNEKKKVIKPFDFPIGYYDKNRISKEVFPILIESSNGRYFPSSLWGKVIRRELCLDNFIKDKYVNIGEDYACVRPCIYHAQSLSVLPDNLYYYRQTETSLTNSKKAFMWNGPQIIAEHLYEKINISDRDFAEQLYRNVIHNLFIVAASQFNTADSYRHVVEDIQQNIDRPFYKKVILNVSYNTTSWKLFLSIYCFKRNIFFPLYLFNKLG